MTECVNCGEPIRRTEPSDGMDPDEYAWTHREGGLMCDTGPAVASPGGDGYGPAPITGYLVDGKLYAPADVTIVRRESTANPKRQTED